MQNRTTARGFILGLLLLFTLGSAGAFAVKQALTTAPNILVLMYHHMTKDPEKVGPYTIPVSEFESDLQYLQKNGYHTLMPAQLLDGIAQKNLPEKPVLITFDDGFESVYAYAYPLLKQYKMNACVTIVGAYTELYSASNDHNLDYSYLTWDEVEELSQSGIFEIGSHTGNLHSTEQGREGCLIRAGESQDAYTALLQQDVGALQEKILAHTGARPLAFAYPYGFYCEESVQPLSQMGFRIAFTCAQNRNLIPNSVGKLLLLGRYNRSGNVATETFFQKIQ